MDSWRVDPLASPRLTARPRYVSIAFGLLSVFCLVTGGACGLRWNSGDTRPLLSNTGRFRQQARRQAGVLRHGNGRRVPSLYRDGVCVLLLALTRVCFITPPKVRGVLSDNLLTILPVVDLAPFGLKC